MTLSTSKNFHNELDQRVFGTIVLERMTYKMIVSSLKRSKKVKVHGGDWQLIKISHSLVEILQKLCILEAPVSITKKHGRPKKSAIHIV